MKKIIIILIAITASMSPVLAKKTWKKGQAEWQKILVSEHFTFEKSFVVVMDLISDKYEMDMINKDGGYIRSAWSFLAKKNGKKDNTKRMRITIKWNHDRTQIQVKTECQHLKGEEWIEGEDSSISTQIREDIQGVLGY